MSPTFRALRNPNYRLYLAGSVVSNTGTWMMRIAQDWLVLALGGGGTALGITTGLQFLPVLLLTPYAGVIADRFPKRRLLQASQATMAFFSLVLGAIAVAGVAEVWMVYVIAVLFGAGSAIDAPARQSFVSEMVETDDLTNAVGLNSASFNAARMLGPALAGLIIGALGSGAAAAGWVILLNAISYVAVIVQLQRMDAALLHAPRRSADRAAGSLRAGVRYLGGQPKMLFVLVLVFFAGTFGMNFQITSALMATEVFDKGASEFGMLGSLMAVGSLTGALLAARRVRIPLRLLVLASLGFGVTEILAGASPSYWIFAAICPLIGFCTLTLLNSANATMQLESDPLMRGRVMAIYMTVVQGGTPLGAPVVGWIGEAIGPRWTLYLGGLFVIAGTALAVALLAHLRGGLASVLTPHQAPGSLIHRVWDNQAVARARK